MHERLKNFAEVGEPTKFGEAMTIVGGHFAKPVENDDLLRMAIEYGLEETQMDASTKAIAATGFTHRYFSHIPTETLDVNTSIERTTDIGASLLTNIIKSKGWQDGIDVFIDTSAFLPTNVNEQVLVKAGLNPNRITTRSYRYACAGAMGAFIDTISDESLKDARVVIAALEPLSLLLDKQQFLSPSTIAFPSIFGDSYTLMAFNPNRFKLQNKDVLIQPDGGVIKLQAMYDFAKTRDDEWSIPKHYRFANNGKGIFHYSKEGAFLDIEKPNAPSKVSMDGMATGFFFGDQTTEVITKLVNEFGDINLLKELNGKNIIMHAASKPVVDRIAKLLRRHENRYLETPSLPFLMDTAKYSNSSSATTLNRWRYMIQNNMLDPNLPMLWIAPGIGSAIAGAIGWINP